MTEKEKQPALYMVATPIGNLEDITYRAVRILSEVDLILSEDTRKTGILLSHYSISTRQKSFRIHQLEQDIKTACEALERGESLGFCTDAGTPGISDPGSALVRTVREKLPDVKIIPIPGPAALSSALSVCGWQTNPSTFYGFPSPKSGKRKKLLEEAASLPGIAVFYESVHRIEKMLGELREIAPDRSILVAREMTKLFEEYLVIDGSISNEEFSRALERLTKKGEFTVILGPEGQKKTYVNS